MVIFETDQVLNDDEFDKIIITSEDNFKLTLNLKGKLNILISFSIFTSAIGSI
ncbi:MAG: hypothetical protein MJ252_01690 [archaeon]|nr:hypothetical protein [archaeon]